MSTDSLKSIDWARNQARNRLSKVWYLEAAGVADYPWDPSIALGSASLSTEEIDSRETRLWALDWLTFRDTCGAQVTTRSRRLATGGKGVEVPDFLIVKDVGEAARLAGPDMAARIGNGKSRALQFRGAFPHTTADEQALAELVKETDGWSDLDVTTLIEAARWASGPDYRPGLTPRQVVMPGIGMQAKWLNARGRQGLVEKLSGRSPLGMANTHPPVVEFTYLDPEYLNSGRRRHDFHAVGDAWDLPYAPRIVLICENKDTAVVFPPVSGGIVVQGNGHGTGAIRGLPWLRPADGSGPVVLYWGDMDSDGLEILAQFRGAGLVDSSILMDDDAYEQFLQLGTNTPPPGKKLEGRVPKLATLMSLTAGEAALYRRLCSETLSSFRRVEQEHIPMAAALEAVLAVAGLKVGDMRRGVSKG